LSLMTRERDLALRICVAPSDEWPRLRGRESGIDSRLFVRELTDVIPDFIAEFISTLGEEQAGSSPRKLFSFARAGAACDGDLALEAIATSRTTGALRGMGYREEGLTVAEEAVQLAEESGDPDALTHAYFARGLGLWVNGDRAAGDKDLQACERLSH